MILFVGSRSHDLPPNSSRQDCHQTTHVWRLLKDVPILSSLDTYQLSKLADALSSETFEPGAQIIKEGDIGDKFYIVENGDAEVTKKSEGKVQDLAKGSYFGEVALLNDLPRQATVTAKPRFLLFI